jgi:antirestriction protein ArdC
MKTDKKDCYEIITERIMDLLNQGEIPWRKPWKSNLGFPRNLISGKPYRGVNVFLLHSLHYESPFFLTFKQALDLGGNVRKGEKACPVVFWKKWDKLNADGSKESIPMMRFYYVFNVAQCENIPAEKLPVVADVETVADDCDYSRAGQIWQEMPNKPQLKHGMAKAYYSPAGDYIGMPDETRFATRGHYYATLFHEATHATGHATRLDRRQPDENINYGSADYSKEELCAEMGSAFLCGMAGIGDTSGLIENSAAYIANWLHALRNDKRLVVQAAGLAQRAADYILNVKHEENAPEIVRVISEIETVIDTTKTVSV